MFPAFPVLLFGHSYLILNSVPYCPFSIAYFMKQQIKQVNQSLGQNATIGILTGFQFAISLVSFGISFFIAFLLGIGMIWSILIGVWVSATALVLSGKRPYLFWSRVFPCVPTFTRGYVKYCSPQNKKRAGSRKVPKSW